MDANEREWGNCSTEGSKGNEGGRWLIQTWWVKREGMQNGEKIRITIMSRS